MQLDPFAIATVDMLAQCVELSAGQLSDLDKFLAANKSQIYSSLQSGLEGDQGAYVALRLLRLQTERLMLLNSTVANRSRIQRPIEESRFLLAVVAQVFHTLSEWMRQNSVDKITEDSLPDLQEFVLGELILQNGYRDLVRADESD